MLSRLAVIVIALIALAIASDRDSRVLNLVSYAWAGFGAAFGPVILFSLFWRNMTALSAVIGMIVGAMTVLIWSALDGGIFELYELAPGFIFASLAIVLVGKLKPITDMQMVNQFEEVESLIGS